MLDLDKLKETAERLLEKAKGDNSLESAAALEKATEVLKLSLEFEKSQSEARRLLLEEQKLRHETALSAKRARAEKFRDYVALATPLVAVMTLAATLAFQGWQFAQSESHKADAAEDARWDEVVRTISQAGKLSPTLIVLNPFLKSTSRYAGQARLAAHQIIVNGTDISLFDEVFNAAYTPMDWAKVDEGLKLARALTAIILPLAGKTYDSVKDENDMSKLTPQEKEKYSYIGYVERKNSSLIGSVLKGPKKGAHTLDFSGAEFFDCNWEGVDLQDTILSNSRFIRVKLKDASFDNITQYDGLYLYKTAWWEAKTISPLLLEFFKSTAPFNPKISYGPNDDNFSQEQYTVALKRLESRNTK